MWGVSLTHPVLSWFLHISCWLLFSFLFIWGVSLTHPLLVLFFIRGVSLTHHMLSSFYLGSFSYTSRAGFVITRGVSFTHPMLTFILCGEFLWHIPCCLGSYTSHAGFFFLSFLSGEFLLHIPCWFCFLSGEFLLHITCWLHFYLESFSYTSLLASFLSGLDLILLGHFLLHIPCWRYFYQGSFCYTPRAGFIFMQGISLTHPMLPSFSCREFDWHIMCCLHFYAESFSYTSQAAFIFMWVGFLTHPMLTSFMRGVSLTHPELTSFLCGQFLLHIPCWIYFWCEQLLSSAVYTEDNPLGAGSWSRRKGWKSHTQTREGSPRTTWTEQNKTRREQSEKVGTGIKGKKRNGSEL